MVAFHDRRSAFVDTVEELAPGLDLRPGDSLSKKVRAGRYVVKGSPTEEGRRFTIYEHLANGAVVERQSGLLSRKDALQEIDRLAPTRTYDI